MKSRLIVIDGIDGCGKGTQIDRLREAFKNKKIIFTHEPGGTPFAEEIRELILKDKEERTPAETDFFLFWASRMNHIENVISPALSKGSSVITDRFDSSTFALQIHGEENFQLLELFETLHEKYIKKLNPLYIFLDLKPEVAEERMKMDSKRVQNRLDLKPIEYHTRVREAFRIFKENGANDCEIIDAERSADEIYEELYATISSALEIGE